MNQAYQADNDQTFRSAQTERQVHRCPYCKYSSVSNIARHLKEVHNVEQKLKRGPKPRPHIHVGDENTFDGPIYLPPQCSVKESNFPPVVLGKRELDPNKPV